MPFVAAVLFASCGKPRNSPESTSSVVTKIVSQRCPPSVPGPEERVDELIATIPDVKKNATERAEAVHDLTCLLTMTKRGASIDPGAELELGLFTGGASEVFLEMSRHSLVSPPKFGAGSNALGDAFCDSSSAVGGVAKRELERAGENLAAAALSRAVKCSDQSRAMLALDVAESSAMAIVRSDHAPLPHIPGLIDWSLPTAYGSMLNDATQSDDAAIRTRAAAALSAVVNAMYDRVVIRARSQDPEELKVRERDVSGPILGPALRRAIPDFRKRFADPSFDIRLAAARTVWLLEGSYSASSDSIAAALWNGLTLPVRTPDATARTRLQAAIDNKGIESEVVSTLDDLARAGPASADALDLIRQCASMRWMSSDAQPTAAAALALVGGDRASLRVLRKRYQSIFADSAMAYGSATGGGETIAGAILYLDPDDQKARLALRIGSGPLLTALTRKLISGDDEIRWLIELMLREQGAASPR